MEIGLAYWREELSDDGILIAQESWQGLEIGSAVQPKFEFINNRAAIAVSRVVADTPSKLGDNLDISRRVKNLNFYQSFGSRDNLGSRTLELVLPLIFRFPKELCSKVAFYSIPFQFH